MLFLGIDGRQVALCRFQSTSAVAHMLLRGIDGRKVTTPSLSVSLGSRLASFTR
ncbi:hypothetical protein DPMN_124982 [Dreissena polymorpha]|uniref:Uncharacterized protein n=1 Tax=Dreissena polymorpha TaxID=45954 RepID=A0A9D4GWN1_DREPO|nr:hypothetical protein DPMN_124982 [Dreissena polymorpha]